MLIRSQDNKKLVNLSNVECISIRTYDDTTDIWCGGYLIGEYSTEEKAIKVLDMFEEKYKALQTSSVIDGNLIKDAVDALSFLDNAIDVITNGLKNNHVFQMPEDEEVEDD